MTFNLVSRGLAKLEETFIPPETERLVITNNQITDLPSKLGELPNLVDLRVFDNKIKYFTLD